MKPFFIDIIFQILSSLQPLTFPLQFGKFPLSLTVFGPRLSRHWGNIGSVYPLKDLSRGEGKSRRVNPETLDNPENMHFRIIEGFRIARRKFHTPCKRGYKAPFCYTEKRITWPVINFSSAWSNKLIRIKYSLIVFQLKNKHKLLTKFYRTLKLYRCIFLLNISLNNYFGRKKTHVLTLSII